MSEFQVGYIPVFSGVAVDHPENFGKDVFWRRVSLNAEESQGDIKKALSDRLSKFIIQINDGFGSSPGEKVDVKVDIVSYKKMEA